MLAVFVLHVGLAAAGSKIPDGLSCSQDSECASGFCTSDTHICAGQDLCSSGPLWIVSESGHTLHGFSYLPFYAQDTPFLQEGGTCCLDEQHEPGRGCNLAGCHWTLSDAGEDKFFIASSDGTYPWTQLQDASAESWRGPYNSVAVANEYTFRKGNGEWEKWTISDAGEGLFFITSYRGEQLSGPFPGVGCCYSGFHPEMTRKEDIGTAQKWRIRTADHRPPCLPTPPACDSVVPECDGLPVGECNAYLLSVGRRPCTPPTHACTAPLEWKRSHPEFGDGWCPLLTSEESCLGTRNCLWYGRPWHDPAFTSASQAWPGCGRGGPTSPATWCATHWWETRGGRASPTVYREDLDCDEDGVPDALCHWRGSARVVHVLESKAEFFGQTPCADWQLWFALTSGPSRDLSGPLTEAGFRLWLQPDRAVLNGYGQDPQQRTIDEYPQGKGYHPRVSARCPALERELGQSGLAFAADAASSLPASTAEGGEPGQAQQRSDERHQMEAALLAASVVVLALSLGLAGAVAALACRRRAARRATARLPAGQGLPLN